MRFRRAFLALCLLTTCPFWSQLANAGSHGGRWNVEEAFPDPRVVAFIAAVESGDVPRAQAQLSRGVSVNYQGKEGITPLVWVMGGGDRNAVERLLRLGADPNQKVAGNSPTWMAAGRHDTLMLELLLHYHGDPNTVGDDGSSALEIAVQEHFGQNVDLLTQHGADINHVDEHGESAATWAAITGRLDLVAHLLELGYSHDLQSLAWTVDGDSVNAEQQPWKARVAHMLQERGVKYPLKPAVPAPPDRSRGEH